MEVGFPPKGQKAKGAGILSTGFTITEACLTRKKKRLHAEPANKISHEDEDEDEEIASLVLLVGYIHSRSIGWGLEPSESIKLHPIEI